MNFNKKNRFGFTLFEVVVSMGVVAIFIAACSNIFTQQHKNRVSNPAHGRVECYWREGAVHQKTYFESMLAGDEVRPDGSCVFVPTRSASYVIISAVGGGGAGGANFGGSAGEFLNMFLPISTHRLQIIPGTGAKITEDEEGNTQIEDGGHSTIVNDIGVEGNDPPTLLLNIKGGPSNSFGSTNENVKLGNCAVTFARYTCGLPYSCEADNEARVVKLRYCTGDGAPPNNPYMYVANKTIPFRSNNGTGILDAYQGYSGDLSEYTEGVISYEEKGAISDQYCDISSYQRNYVLALTIFGNNTPYQDRSPMEGYINALGIQNTEGSISNLPIPPGNGGGVAQNGGDGAVIIVW